MTLFIDQNLNYSVSPEVAIEDFSDISLLFLAGQLRLLEINSTAKSVLSLMNGLKNIKDIIKSISTNFNIDAEKISPEILDLIAIMISEGVIYPEVKLKKNGELNMSENTKFIANPDVSCRIEDEEGAILFNPDSDSTQVINPIGLDIWKSIERHPRTISEVISHIVDIYENVPSESVKEDVEGFIMNLHSKGFIGEVVDEKE